MAIPHYGALPLSQTFLAVRALQIISMIVILALTANFTNNMIMGNLTPSKEIVGTLVIASLATLYTLVSIAFYWSAANLGLYVMAGLDTLLMIAWSIAASVVGKPVSYMNCYHPEFASDNVVGDDGAFFGEVLQRLNQGGLQIWSGLSKSNCLQAKAIWGFGIVMA